MFSKRPKSYFYEMQGSRHGLRTLESNSIHVQNASFHSNEFVESPASVGQFSHMK